MPATQSVSRVAYCWACWYVWVCLYNHMHLHVLCSVHRNLSQPFPLAPLGHIATLPCGIDRDWALVCYKIVTATLSPDVEPYFPPHELQMFVYMRVTAAMDTL